MTGHAHEVEGEPDAAGADVDVVALRQEVDGLVRIVGARDLVDRKPERDAPPRFDEAGGGPDPFGRDVVEGSYLVIGAPPTPVLDRLEDLVELLEAHRAWL